jgi:hypothetical protein
LIIEMPERIEIRKEAIARQGTIINGRLAKGRRAQYFIEGDQQRAKFQMGEEGLVHWAVEKRSGAKHRIKFFWEPDDIRFARSRHLVEQGLANQNSSIDVLGGAPFALLDSIGGLSRFALIMKNVEGVSWKDLRENFGAYPPSDWPSFDIRLLWAYGLVCAVEQMEARKFVHADLSDGNVVVVPTGDRAGVMALVDFDAYFNPDYPSNYRGTSGFVAPEIWNRGAVGVGSDRVAMAILIQEFLIVGDPELSSDHVFEGRYAQDQICALQCTAHPQLRRKYAAVANLVDATLTAASRELRPEPQKWRETLRPLFRQGKVLNLHFRSSTGDTDVPVALMPGEKKNLMRPPFFIRADILRTPDGALHLRPRPGASIRLHLAQGSWREISDGMASLTGDTGLYDGDGELLAHLTIDEPAEEDSDIRTAQVLKSFETGEVKIDEPNLLERVRQWLSDLTKISIPEIDWKTVGLALLAVLAIVLLSFLLWRIISFDANSRPRKEATGSNPPKASANSPPGSSGLTDAAAGDAQPKKEESVEQAPIKPPPVKRRLPSSKTASENQPPSTEHTDPSAGLRADETPPTPAHPPSDRPPEPPVYRGPTSGDFVWSGTVEKGQLIEIIDGVPNIGSLSGRLLPGVPVSITPGISQIAVEKQPNPLNHFSGLTLRSTIKGHIAFGVHWEVLPVN